MSRNIPSFIVALSGTWLLQLQAQDIPRLTFNLRGGVSAPLNQYVGVSGNFVGGAGVSLNKHNSVEGDFAWSGLPPSLTVIHPVNAPSGSMNLYSLGANYRYHVDSIHGSLLGAYMIAGGGWYYRYAKIDQNYVVPPSTACLPIYTWWGYRCTPGGFVESTTVAYKGVSSGGLNAGAGVTFRLSDTRWKFYTEARYTYAWSSHMPTRLVPVTFGFRYN